jgi:hypothetical protein
MTQTIVNYQNIPFYLVSEQTEGYLITITPMAVPTIQNYDYFNRTVYVISEPRSQIVSQQSLVAEITVY